MKQLFHSYPPHRLITPGTSSQTHIDPVVDVEQPAGEVHVGGHEGRHRQRHLLPQVGLSRGDDPAHDLLQDSLLDELLHAVGHDVGYDLGGRGVQVRGEWR